MSSSLKGDLPVPSSKPVIALRLEQALYDRVVAVAQQQGRTPANFIAQQLRVSLSMTPSITKQVDLVDEVVAAVKRGPVRKVEKQRPNEECLCGSGLKFKKCHGRSPGAVRADPRKIAVS
jgi:hypothetical protein